MNKSDFVKVFASKTDLSIKDATTVFDAALDLITEIMKKGEKLQLSNFGIFEGRRREAYTAKSFGNEQPVTVATCIMPSFKPAKALKDTLNS